MLVDLFGLELQNLFSFPFSLSLSLVLFYRYPSLRVAYIDEVEENVKDKSDKSRNKVEKVYYSALVKAVPKSVDDTSETDQKLDQVIILINRGVAFNSLYNYQHVGVYVKNKK